MTPIPIKVRETEEYALNQPDMLRVTIADGAILTDRREEFFSIHAPKKGAHQDGQR
jgi:hypothetical protein